MNTPTLICNDDRRRMRLVDGNECAFNGIEYVEAVLLGNDKGAQLRVHFQEVISLSEDAKWKIEAVRRTTSLGIKLVAERECVPSATVMLNVEGEVDGSWYRLWLLNPEHHQVDPHFSSYEFRFPSTESDLNDLDESECGSRLFPTPQIDYLARDYSRLKRLLFDRLSVTMPDWKERHVPDIGVMLVELFAYVGDHLSYQQDAIATEAYLGTARQRISVRRHARLVDYRLHEGCNARTFVHINAPQGDELDPDDVVFISGLPLENSDPPQPVSLDDWDDKENLPLVYFEACSLPDRDPAVKPSDITDCLEFLRRMEAATRGCLAVLWQCLPTSLSFAVRATLYSPGDCIDSLVDDVLKQVNVSLREVWLASHIERDEVSCCSVSTRDRITLTSQHQCPAATNRAILEDLFPELVTRRVTKSDKIRLFAGHNEIRFYTWDGSRCWLPRGATSATLQDSYLPTADSDGKWHRALQNLHVGDILLFEEVRGSRTGEPADADPLHRQVVRLTKVFAACDPVRLMTGPDGNQARQPIVEIEWHPDDALNFPLCLSARGRGTIDCHLVEDVSIARGNIILVDQGRTITGEMLGSVAGNEIKDPCADPNCCGTCQSESPPQVAARHYRPTLKLPDLTFAQPLIEPERDKVLSRPMAASAMLVQAEHKAEPQLFLRGISPSPDIAESEISNQNFSMDRLLQQLRVSPLDLCRMAAHLLPGKRCREVANIPAWVPHNEQERELLLRLKRDLETAMNWRARNDLIDTTTEVREFTVEIDDDRNTRLRFPEDSQNQPRPGSRFWATYRTGNGSAGNVGAGGITHIGFRKQSLLGRGLSVRNPLPAAGGKDPESVTSAKMLAPTVTRKIKRAVTADDYAAVVLQEFPTEIQSARASLSPGPLGQKIRVAIDPYARVLNCEELRNTVQRELKKFQRIGHDVQVQLATEVPINLSMRIRVLPGYHFEHVRAELLRRFNSGVHPDGLLGYFHPDRRTFGDGIYVSDIIATARRVTGVRGVIVENLSRLGQATSNAIDTGLLPMGPLEVAVLQGGASRTHGRLTINHDNVTEVRR